LLAQGVIMVLVLMEGLKLKVKMPQKLKTRYLVEVPVPQSSSET